MDPSSDILIASSVAGLISIVYRIYKLIIDKKDKAKERIMIIIRYLLINISFKIGIIFQKPYAFRHYIQVKTMPYEIAILVIVPFIVKRIWKFIPIGIVKDLGYYTMIFIASGLSALGFVLRTKKNFDALCVSEVIVCISECMFDYALFDWRFGDASRDKSTDKFITDLQFLVENIVYYVVGFCSLVVQTLKGDKEVFYVSAICQILPLIMGMFTMKLNVYPYAPPKKVPNYIGMFIMLGIAIFEIYFLSRTYQYLGKEKIADSLWLLYAFYASIDFLTIDIHKKLIKKLEPIHIILGSSIVCAAASFTCAIFVNQDYIVAPIMLVTAVFVYLIRQALPALGTSPIETSIPFIVAAGIAYHFFVDTPLLVQLYISAGGAIFSAICCILYMKYVVYETEDDIIPLL